MSDDMPTCRKGLHPKTPENWRTRMRHSKQEGYCHPCQLAAAAARREARRVAEGRTKWTYDPHSFPCGHARTPENTAAKRCRECRRAYDQVREEAQRAAEGREKKVYDSEWFPCGHPRIPVNQTSFECCRVCDIARSRKYGRGRPKTEKERQAVRDRQRMLKQAEKDERADPETAEFVRMVRCDPCAYCGGPGGTRDHIIPMISGGPNHWENYTGACLSCNTAKSGRSLLGFLLDRAELAQVVRRSRTA